MNDNLIKEFSEKLTQLTRIIFILNEKNEQNEAIVEEINSYKEKEFQEEKKNLIKQISLLKKKINDIEKSYEEKYENFKLDIEYKYNSIISKYKKEFDNKKK